LRETQAYANLTAQEWNFDLSMKAYDQARSSSGRWILLPHSLFD
jgi:hypothetical protein